MSVKLDILVFASHPDDAELGCGGTIALEVSNGRKVGIVDLTRGELGTRGTPEQRLKEAEKAAAILGLAVRENLGLRDGYFRNSEDDQRALIVALRRYRPDIVLANAVRDRHPDHGRAAGLIYDSCFLSGLARIETDDKGKPQPAWRPSAVYHYIQSQYIRPDFVVDVTAHWARKMEAIATYTSQFYNPDSKEPETFISGPNFLPFIEARAVEFGHSIGAKYGEGFTSSRHIGVKSLSNLI